MFAEDATCSVMSRSHARALWRERASASAAFRFRCLSNSDRLRRCLGLFLPVAANVNARSIFGAVRCLHLTRPCPRSWASAHACAFFWSLVRSATRPVSVGETYVFASAASQLSTLETDYNTIRQQISELVEDSAYLRGILWKEVLLTEDGRAVENSDL